MSIFSSIGNAVKGAYNAVKSVFSGSSQTASAANVFGSPAYIAQNVSSGIQPASGPGSASYATTSGYNPNISARLPNGAAGPVNPYPNQINYGSGGFNTGGGVGSASYGPQLPVTISSGTQKSSGSSGTSSAKSLGSVSSPAPVVMQRSSLTSSGLSAPTTGGSSTGSPISVPNAPSSTNPKLDTTGLAGAVSGYYTRNPDGTYTEVKADKGEETDQQTTEKLKSVFDQLGPKDNVYDDPEVVKARQRKDQIQQSLQAPTNELNAIIAQQNQDLLQLRKTGAAEGVTEAVYGNQSNTINYNAAIRALPLQASIAATQGDLKLAQDYLSEVTQVKKEQIDNQYNYNARFLDALVPALDKKQERKYQEMKAENDRQRKEATDLEDFKAEMAQTALKNGATSQSVFSGIHNAKDKFSAVQAAGQYAGDVLDRQYKQAQLNKLNAEVKALNPDLNLTNPDAAQYSGALSTILGSSKFTKEQKATVINSVNKGEDPFSVIKNQAKNIMGQTESTNVTKLEVARDTLSDIGNQLAQFYANGGKTSIFSGNFEKVINKLGSVSDPKLVALATQIQGNLQIYRNAISGTAYSAQEGKDISSIFPGINKSESLNKAILSGRSTLFDSVIDSTYRTVLGKTYDELKKSQTSTKDQYTPQREQLKSGEILIERNGQIGAVPAGEFNPKTDKKL